MKVKIIFLSMFFLTLFYINELCLSLKLYSTCIVLRSSFYFLEKLHNSLFIDTSKSICFNANNQAVPRTLISHLLWIDISMIFMTENILSTKLSQLVTLMVTLRRRLVCRTMDVGMSNYLLSHVWTWECQIMKQHF